MIFIMEKKQYNFAAGFYIYKKEFQNGGHILNVSGDYTQFTAWLKTICDESGRFRLTIAEKRDKVEKKPTHNCWEDQYKPRPRQDDYDQRPQEERQQAARTNSVISPAQADADDGLPF
jgi:hypothetical protein